MQLLRGRRGAPVLDIPIATDAKGVPTRHVRGSPHCAIPLTDTEATLAAGYLAGFGASEHYTIGEPAPRAYTAPTIEADELVVEVHRAVAVPVRGRKAPPGDA